MSSQQPQFKSKQFLTAISTVAILAMPFTLSQAHAQPSESSIRQLMQVTHVDKMMEQAASQNALLVPQLTRQLIASKAGSLNDSQKARLNTIANDYLKQMLKELNSEQAKQQMINDYIKTAQKHYSQAEVDAQVKFYGSDLGQSIIKKQPVMMQNYMQTIMPAIMQRTDKSMKDIAPKLEADVKNVLADSK